MPDDIVDALLKQILEAAPELSREKALASAVKVRQDWGGSKHYVKKAPAEGKTFGLGTALAAGVPLAQAFAEVGVSTRHGMRLIGRRWRIR